MESQLILDRYRPLEDLGEGGFGTVTLAWDTRMQRRVAVKRMDLPLDASGNPHQPPGLAEARTAAMLNHPHIVTVLDFDTDSDEAFLIMEYVEGASLARILDDLGGPLTLDETAAVFEAVADALAFAHDNGVLHLDIKPENVLVTREGRVKVTDFGMAELSTATGHRTAFGGTPGYMPLEQLEGKTVTERTDEWALAVLAYECLTGDNPFFESSPEAAVIRLGVFEPPPVSNYEPELPGEIDDVLLAALGTRPAERYETIEQFEEMLLPHLGDPATGRASLGEIVSAYADEPDEADAALERLGLWDRLPVHLGSTLIRGVAAIESAWLAWAGLSPTPVDPWALAAAAMLIGLAGALAPPLGIGLGLGCMIAGLAISGSWAIAAGLALGGGVWWWFAARHDTGASVLPLAAPVLGAVRLALAQPLLAGFTSRPLAAAVTGLAGGVLSMLASAMTLHGAPYLAVSATLALRPWETGLSGNSVQALVTSPASWTALAAWPVAAAAMSAACGRATRGGAVLGTVAGISILSLGYLLADRVSQAMGHDAGLWSGVGFALPATGSLILMLLVIALGPPLRSEEARPTH